jgi:hypothetical protein
MDFDVDRCTRHCAVTGRPLTEGEEFYSALVRSAGSVARQDYSLEAWHGAPDGAIGWWKSKMPQRDSKRAQMAPSEVLLEFFESLADSPEAEDMRYVMALWMLRRRILRMEETQRDTAGREVLVLYCPRTETTHRVASLAPSDERVAEIQAELGKLLFATS